MTLRIEIPEGISVPMDWMKRKSVPLAEFNAWLHGQYVAPKQRRSKFGAKQGMREDIGFSVRSKLEANATRLLLFRGFQRFTEKYPAEPPKTGRFFRYEGRMFSLPYKYRGREKVQDYLIDFELWEDGRYSLWEVKGLLDAKSKRKLKLMEQHHPDIPLLLVTAPVLNDMARTAKSLIKEWE